MSTTGLRFPMQEGEAAQEPGEKQKRMLEESREALRAQERAEEEVKACHEEMTGQVGETETALL